MREGRNNILQERTREEPTKHGSKRKDTRVAVADNELPLVLVAQTSDG
jgi:hypothetical protein